MTIVDDQIFENFYIDSIVQRTIENHRRHRSFTKARQAMHTRARAWCVTKYFFWTITISLLSNLHCYFYFFLYPKNTPLITLFVVPISFCKNCMLYMRSVLEHIFLNVTSSTCLFLEDPRPPVYDLALFCAFVMLTKFYCERVPNSIPRNELRQDAIQRHDRTCYVRRYSYASSAIVILVI